MLILGVGSEMALSFEVDHLLATARRSDASTIDQRSPVNPTEMPQMDKLDWGENSRKPMKISDFFQKPWIKLTLLPQGRFS